ncbi:hypothetical protein [Streptomyces sp. NPDC001833]
MRQLSRSSSTTTAPGGGNDGGTPKLGIDLLDWSSGWPVAY